VNLTQFMLGYKRNQEWKNFRIDFDAELFYAPGPMVGNESNADYNELRPNAKNQYIYAKAALRYFQNLPMSFTMTAWIRGQLSSQNLLPSEQFGIGGYDTVRGYDERQLSMDTAFVGNLEFRTPAISMITMLRNCPAKDALQFLGFIDYGYGKNHNLFEGEPLSAYLLSIGPGVRYTFDPYLAIRADYGVKLHHLAYADDFEAGELHFSVTASY
jgi:hemolysin activation/secretion protein